VVIPLLSVTHGQYDARPTVTFPAARNHRQLGGTKLYCCPQALSIDGCRLSVCPSKSRTERHSKLEIGRKEAEGDPWPHFEVKKVKVTRPIKAVTENQPYFRNGKAYILKTWYTDGVRWPTSLTCAVTSKLKALCGCCHFPGMRSYCGGRPPHRPHSWFRVYTLCDRNECRWMVVAGGIALES